MEDDEVLGPFTFLHKYRTFVYRNCEFAVLVNEVSSHLVKRPQKITPTERRNIVRDTADLPDARRIQADLQGFCFPPPTIDCVPYLAPPETDGLKCHECPYIARQVQKIQKCLLFSNSCKPLPPGRYFSRHITTICAPSCWHPKYRVLGPERWWCRREQRSGYLLHQRIRHRCCCSILPISVRQW